MAARDNEHLERVIQPIVALPGVVRTRTEVALNERIPYRIAPLVRAAKPPSTRAPGPVAAARANQRAS